MTILKTTKRNRRTGTEISLHRDCPGLSLSDIYKYVVYGDCDNVLYFLECCGHGYLSEEYETRKEAVAMMSKPDEWCVGCIEGDPVENETK
jgi:hypothetical protein